MTSVTTTPSAATPRLAGTAMAARRLWWFAPLLFAAAYLVTLATQFNRLLAISYLNSDSASAPVIGELFHQRGGHALVLLGHLAWYSTLLFEIGTRWLPLHRQIWEATPYAMALASAALVGWGAWRVAGRWAGAISAAIMICAAPTTLSLLFVLNDHAPTWFTLALLGAFLVLLAQRAEGLSSAWLALLATVVGIVLGANGASDVLLVIAGVLPFLLAAGSVWVLHPSRRTATAGVVAVGTVLVAIVSGVLLHHFMHQEGVIPATDHKQNLLVTTEGVGTNFRLWWQSIANLGNGNFFGQTIGFTSVLELVCAVMTIAVVVVVVPRIAQGQLANALAARRREAHEPVRTARLAWSVFWASSLVLLSAGFIFSNAPEGPGEVRYLVGVLYAAAALVPLLGSRGPLTRVAVTAGATLFAFTGWLTLAQQQLAPAPSPSDQLAGTVAKIAREEHLSVGYAGYWDAAPITWATHLHVKVFPVDDCDGDQHLCAYEQHIITTWYTPRPGAKTFLLSDPAWPQATSAPTPDLGKPIVIHQIGSVTMYVYPYDIAARLFAL